MDNEIVLADFENTRSFTLSWWGNLYWWTKMWLISVVFWIVGYESAEQCFEKLSGQSYSHNTSLPQFHTRSEVLHQVWEKQTYHIHILQMANQLLINHRQDSLQWGGMGWWPYLENDPPTSNGLFWCPEIFFLIVQHNIIEFQKHKRSGHPNEKTFTVVIKW